MELLYNTGSATQRSVTTLRGRLGWGVVGGEVQETGDMCILTADSCCGMAEANPTS